MLEIVHGDVLELEVDAIVVPPVPQEGVLSESAERIYKAAGYQDMLDAYQTAKHSAEGKREKSPKRLQSLPVPSILVTPGFNLKAKHAIHICLNTTSSRSGQANSERRNDKHIPYSSFYYSYYHALDCAFKELGAKSVAIPLEEFSRAKGEDVANSWIKYNTPPPSAGYTLEDGTFVRRRSMFDSSKIFLVLPISNTEVTPAALPVAPPAPVQEKIVFIPMPHKTPEPAEVDSECAEEIAKFEESYEKARKRKSEPKIREYNIKKCIEYFERIPNASEFANILGIHPSNITRYKNYFWGSKNKSKPSPKMIVALSILIGLNGCERYEFFRCALGKYPYDSDIYNQTEMIIRRGIKSFSLINKELCRIDPKFDLTKNKNEPKQKPPAEKNK